jgi:PPK2 family polyphosphate:nucleotide phosphotransferase
MLNKEIARAILAPTDGSFRLKDYDPAWPGTKEMRALKGDALEARARAFLEEHRKHLSEAQEKLYADDRYSLLILFQAMDAGGKDGTIKSVMSGVNPQGVQVFAFKQPSAEELDHNFLWRYWRALPERGRIGIFNRSYYEEVLVVRVHPAILEKQRLPMKTEGRKLWETRYDDINAFERHLWHNGTVVLKFFLNVSKDEQRRRFIDRLTEEDKLWKFSMADLVERGFWDEYQQAYDEMIRATSTKWAPWYVVPADNKWKMRAIVSHVICDTIGGLDLRFPTIPPARMKELKDALKKLRAEK